MKNTLSLLSVALFAGSMSFAAGKKAKIDWKPCQKELQEYCTASTNDTEKHECIEEAPPAMISKACKEHNEKLEKELSHKHEEGHSH